MIYDRREIVGFDGKLDEGYGRCVTAFIDIFEYKIYIGINAS